MAELLSDTMPGHFAMVTINNPDGPVREALRCGAIELADLGVLWLLLDHVVWQSCRFWGDAAQLAAAMGDDNPAAIEQSLARLQQAGLIARGRSRRYPASRHYWCVLPTVATTGGKGKRMDQKIAFGRALNEAQRITAVDDRRRA
ncbi:MAG: hypothetical protein VKI42_06700 [Synechococcaceae cyanobacterium]|nr:hypothetical protein [Synechococcaceae cyanobacterium]